MTSASVKTRRILVLGAGPFQVPLIEKAKALGCTVYATSNRPGDVGRQLADRPLTISILDIPALEALCRKENIQAIVTGASDLGSISVARLNECLGLPGLTRAQVLAVSDKGQFVRLQARLGLPHPQSFEVAEPGDLERVIDGFTAFPAIVKPFNASGSRGVRVVADIDGLREAHDFVFQQSFLRKGYLVQGFLHGIEHGGECLVENGHVVFLALTHKFHNSSFVPTGHFVPYEPDTACLDSLKRQIEQLAEHLKIVNSPLNIDVIFPAEGPPVLIDLSFRLGGNMLPQLMELQYGVDTVRRCLDYCLGNPLEPLVPAVASAGGRGAIILGSPVAGTASVELFARTQELFESSADVIEMKFDVMPGDRVHRFSEGSHRVGHVVFRVNDRADFERLLLAEQEILQRSIHVEER